MGRQFSLFVRRFSLFFCAACVMLVGASAPSPAVGAAAAAAAGAELVAGKKGAGVIATHDFKSEGRAPCLGAFFVLEKRKGNLRFCWPLERNDGAEAAPTCAARSLVEELHLLDGPGAAELAQPERFAHVKAKGVPHLFVALQPGAREHCGGESGNFTRALFHERRTAVVMAQTDGAAAWRGRAIGDFLETLDVVNVDVASLQSRVDGRIRPTDVYGVPLRFGLRGVCDRTLEEAAVQSALGAALENFYGRHPDARPPRPAHPDE